MDLAIGLALIFRMSAEARAFVMLVRGRARRMFDQIYASSMAQICYYEAVACFFEAGDWLRAADELARDPAACAEDVRDAMRSARELEAYAHERLREGAIHRVRAQNHYFDDTGDYAEYEPLAYAISRDL